MTFRSAGTTGAASIMPAVAARASVLAAAINRDQNCDGRPVDPGVARPLAKLRAGMSAYVSVDTGRSRSLMALLGLSAPAQETQK